MLSPFSSDVYFYCNFKGFKWQLVFFHNFIGQVMFSSESEALSCSSPGKYSILSQISDMFKINNKFEFIIEYPSLSYYFQWRQTNNPITELEVLNKFSADGFEPIHNGTYSPDWGGLVKTTLLAANKINTLLDGNPGMSNWFFSIGMYNIAHSPYNTDGIPHSSNPPTDVVRLWIRLPGNNIDCTVAHHVSIYILRLVIVSLTSLL